MIFENRNFNYGVTNQSYFKDVSTDEYYKLNYFREGISDEDLFNDKKVISLFSNNRIYFINQNDYIINDFNINVNKYNSYYIIDGDYKKEFYYNHETNSFNTMRRGRIYGNINLKSCAVESFSDIRMLVYRQPDRQYIGSYKVTNTGVYDIPNLDTNSEYDIILYDTKRKIEQQVHSFRSPTETIIPQINASLPYNINCNIILSNACFEFNIDKDVYKDYKYCRLVYVGLDGMSYEVIRENAFTFKFQIPIYSSQLKFGFYKVESVYNDLISSSDLFEIKDTSVLSQIVIPNSTYTPPNGDNINIIIGV